MIKTSKHPTNAQYGRRVILAIATSALLLALGCVDRAEWGGKESDLLQAHRSDLEHLAKMVTSWEGFDFVARSGSDDYSVLGWVATDSFVYLSFKSLPGDDRPLYAQPYDSLIDPFKGISLAQVLDSSGVPFDSFAVLCTFLEQNDLHGVQWWRSPPAIMFGTDDNEGIGYRLVANSELSGTYPESTLIIDERWFWYID